MAKTTNNGDEPTKSRKGLDLLYRLTHYDSYHSYRVRMAIVRSLLWLAVVLYIYKLFIPNYQTDIFVNDIIIFLLGSYLIAYYSVTAKASIMFKDSAYVMRKIAFSGVISNSWNIYDGILKDPEEGEVSVEITFFKEKAFLVNVFDLMRKSGKTLPLTKDDIENLKRYIEVLDGSQALRKKFEAYATLSDEMAKTLSDAGILLTRLDNHYRTKPYRWDYARTTGKWSNALFGYPSSWNAYRLNTVKIDHDKMDQQQAGLKNPNLSEEESYINLNR